MKILTIYENSWGMLGCWVMLARASECFQLCCVLQGDSRFIWTTSHWCSVAVVPCTTWSWGFCQFIFSPKFIIGLLSSSSAMCRATIFPFWSLLWHYSIPTSVDAYIRLDGHFYFSKFFFYLMCGHPTIVQILQTFFLPKWSDRKIALKGACAKSARPRC